MRGGRRRVPRVLARAPLVQVLLHRREDRVLLPERAGEDVVDVVLVALDGRGRRPLRGGVLVEARRGGVRVRRKRLLVGREVRPEVLEVRLRHDLEVGLELVQALRGVLELRAVGRGPLLGLVELLLGAVDAALDGLRVLGHALAAALDALERLPELLEVVLDLGLRLVALPRGVVQQRAHLGLALARLVEVALQALHEVLGLLHGVLQLAAVRPRLLELRVHVLPVGRDALVEDAVLPPRVVAEGLEGLPEGRRLVAQRLELLVGLGLALDERRLDARRVRARLHAHVALDLRELLGQEGLEGLELAAVHVLERLDLPRGGRDLHRLPQAVELDAEGHELRLDVQLRDLVGALDRVVQRDQPPVELRVRHEVAPQAPLERLEGRGRRRGGRRRRLGGRRRRGRRAVLGRDGPRLERAPELEDLGPGLREAAAQVDDLPLEPGDLRLQLRQPGRRHDQAVVLGDLVPELAHEPVELAALHRDEAVGAALVAETRPELVLELVEALVPGELVLVPHAHVLLFGGHLVMPRPCALPCLRLAPCGETPGRPPRARLLPLASRRAVACLR